ncbi:RHS repeat domain-containing protein [Pseudomonas sp. KNUC1026]|uniref:RHS repeat domain-containing protein n=1 Tax=Pseudomonas sp. KNUC1026 TaxID=2893890 RepID=UPI001F43F6C4|nr:RHS repeat-associated core domain-containing protein [Pseudomonas sp. KNUC1026]UFH48286.1 hypothetical protein LN139_14040 [Pseudomonas sp. KNUC1026]
MSSLTNVQSNAHNYCDYLNAGVDPRTGQFTAVITFPEFFSANMAGPTLPLALSFNAADKENHGFGIGWSINLTRYNPDNNRLLSTQAGETFRVDQSSEGDVPARLNEQKLDTFHFHAPDLTRGPFTVIHRSGLIEHLRLFTTLSGNVALPERIENAQGHTLKASYTADQTVRTPQLNRLEDASGNVLLTIDYRVDGALLRLAPQEDGSEHLSMDFQTRDRRLDRVSVVGVDNAQWAFGYTTKRGYLCIEQVRTPEGTVDRVRYDDAGHLFPGRPAEPALPRVTEHELDPGLGMPATTTFWSYSTQNYLGYGSQGVAWENDGSDQLYKQTQPDFRYSTTADQTLPGTTDEQRQVLRSTTRTYDRFHQRVEQRTEQNGCVITDAVAYHTEPNKPFKDQPPYFQMPSVQEKIWRHAGGQQIQQERFEYDTHGNLTWEQSADGHVTEYSYYPIDGEGLDCPAEPNGFPNKLKAVIQRPAAGHAEGAPVRKTVYRYQWVPPLDGDGITAMGSLMECERHVQTLGPGDQVEQALGGELTHYHIVPSDPLLHGRIVRKQQQHNGFVHTTDFEYALGNQRKGLGARTLITTQRRFGHDGKGSRLHSPIETWAELSTLTGQTLASGDEDGVVTRFEYDGLNRLMHAHIEGDYPATRSYRYRFMGPDNNGSGNETVSIDVNGVEIVTLEDGLGRMVKRLRSLEDGSYVLLERQAWNTLNQCTEHAEYDDFPGAPYELLSRFVYDDWGNLYRSTAPDGVVTVTEVSHTPLAPAVSSLTSWQEHPQRPGECWNKFHRQANLFGKTDFEQRYTFEGGTEQVAGKTSYRYDGDGRCVEEQQQLRDLGKGAGLLAKRTTTYSYDACDRIVTTQRPDHSVIRSRFDPSTPLAQVVCVEVGQGGRFVTAGQQRFDSLGRLTSRAHGDLAETFTYRDGSNRIDTRTLASGEVLTYSYEPSLAQTATQVATSSGASTQHYRYHPGTGQVIEGEESGSSLNPHSTAFEYDRLGQLKKSVLKRPGQPDHATRLNNSRLGRRLERADDSAVPTQHTYDACGRIATVTQGPVCTRHLYNIRGQLEQTVTDSPEGTLTCTFAYDDLGRETQRTIQLPGQPEYVVGQCFSDDDMPLQRTYHRGGQLCLEERFQYDLLGRLSWCAYTGEPAWLPKGRYGQPLLDEAMEFDELGNLTRVNSTYGDAQPYVDTIYEYHPDNLSQVRQVTYFTEDPRYQPSPVFTYDANGCMTSDGERLLRYDTLGRLVSIHDRSGATLRQYRYDPHNELVATIDAAGEETVHFHDGLQLHHRNSNGERTQLMYAANGNAVAQHSDKQHRLLATSPQGSVHAAPGNSSAQWVSYDAWGNPGDALQTALGFNGEALDPELHGYLLGKGYRAYLPWLRRFNAPDSASPFEGGGLNPYAYASGNPVAYQDPTGHYTSKMAGPQRIAEPEPAPKITFWQRWSSVVIAAALTVASLAYTAYSFGLGAPLLVSTITSAASLTWSTLAAMEIVKDNLLIGIMFMVVDLGSGALAGKLAGKGAKFAAEIVEDVPTIIPRAKIAPWGRRSLPSIDYSRNTSFSESIGSGYAASISSSSSVSSVHSLRTNSSSSNIQNMDLFEPLRRNSTPPPPLDNTPSIIYKFNPQRAVKKHSPVIIRRTKGGPMSNESARTRYEETKFSNSETWD